MTMPSSPISVLCVTDYFLPGYLGGGPIRTLDNMRQLLAGQVTLSIFTRDRDLGAELPYDGIEPDCWRATPEGPVYYAGPGSFGPKGLRHALATGTFDLVYLNSFFSPRSSILLNLMLRRLAPELPVLLAPRGEFSPGALAVKPTKKRAFVALARRLGFYRRVAWHASTDREAQDILRQFPRAEGRIHVAPDPVVGLSPAAEGVVRPKRTGALRLAFISRISPKKNLDGLLSMLATVCAPVTLDIFGPVEDEAHWAECRRLIEGLPDNVTVAPHGPLPPEAVSATFAGYDLFAFPTHGENFGHVIFEALRAGTPVLVSDQTPWQQDEAGAVTALPLVDREGWRRAIEQAAQLTPAEQEAQRAASVSYAARYAADDASHSANLEMFRSILP